MTDFTTPVGRMIGGSIYKTAEKKPKPGEPLKSTTPMYEFGIAIPKAPGQVHWRVKPANYDAENPRLAGQYWGEKIYAAGVAEFGAQVCDHPSFAWKITDGDSATAATAGGAAPNTKEGYKGCWVLWFSGSTAPMLYNAAGNQVIKERDYLKAGHYIQVMGNVRGNGNKPGNSENKKSGVYLNHTYVAHSNFGPEISYKPDVASAGFGDAAMPVGASTTPVGALPGGATAPLPPAPGVAMPSAGGAPQYAMTALAAGFSREQMNAGGWKDADLIAQGYMLAPVVAAPPVAMPPAAPVTATAVMPNPGMIPSGPPVPPVGPKFVMTPLAQGYTREQMHGNGWTDETLQTNGYMVVAP